MKILQKIDNFLNDITMYKLVLYGLMLLALVAIVLGFTKQIYYGGLSMLVSLVALFFSTYTLNVIFGKLFNTPVNADAPPITSLILFFLLTPPQSFKEVVIVVIVGAIAMLSKFILALNKKHLFNPAAVAAVVASILGITAASWWVATLYLLPFSLILGLLVVRKIRRFTLFFTTVFFSTAVAIILNSINQVPFWDALRQHFVSWPIIFFASIMVTEPLTTPPTRKLQLVYGAFVGALSSVPFHFGPVYSSPELALVLGNIFSYTVSFKHKLFPVLLEKKLIANNTYEFVFNLPFSLSHKPGQYMEWTLDHKKIDQRGVRRYFTISSSPTENDLKLGIKVAEPSSTFKTALVNLQPGQNIIANQILGDFVLPKETEKKLVFIAGGVGITPFRSMIKYIIDKGEKRDVVLFYSNRTEKDIAYKDLFEEAANKFGLKTVYVVTDPGSSNWQGESGVITEAMLKKYLTNLEEKHFYLSGPNAMVDAYGSLLKNLGVHKSQILTDYFPGL